MSEHITHPAAVRRLERPTSDRRIAGVAGGLGRYFDLNPSFFRIGFVVLTLLGGARADPRRPEGPPLAAGRVGGSGRRNRRPPLTCNRLARRGRRLDPRPLR